MFVCPVLVIMADGNVCAFVASFYADFLGCIGTN